MSQTDHIRTPPATVVAGLLLTGLLGLLLIPCVAAAADPSDIVLVAAEGDVRIESGGTARSARPGSVLELPATVRTGRASSADLRQGDTTIGVGPDTELNFPASAQAGDPIERVTQPLGNAFYAVPPLGGRRLRVETPYLVAVIKGTQFNVAATADSSTISLYEGRLQVSATEGGIPPVELNAGEIAIRQRDEPTIRVLQMKNGLPPAATAAAASEGDENDDAIGLKPVDPAGNMPDLPHNPSPFDDEIDVIIGTPSAGTESGVDASVGLGLTGTGAAASVGLDLGAGTIDATASAGVDLGAAGVDAGLGAGADLGAGTVDASASAGVDLGAASVDAGLDAGIDLGAGTVDTGVGIGLDLGAVEADVGVDLGVDLGLGGESAPPAGDDGGILGGILRRTRL